MNQSVAPIIKKQVLLFVYLEHELAQIGSQLNALSADIHYTMSLKLLIWNKVDAIILKSDGLMVFF